MGKARTFRRAKPARSTGCTVFGILNPYGDLWTWQTFGSEEEARAHVRDFWRGMQGEANTDQFTIIPVKVTVSDARPTPSPQESGR